MRLALLDEVFLEASQDRVGRQLVELAPLAL